MTADNRLRRGLAALAGVVLAVSTASAAEGQGRGAGQGQGPDAGPDQPGGPAIVSGEVLRTVYDGVNDDLLTAGLGASGLASSDAPAVSDPPTAAELRRLAIYNNYRALVDTTEGGGYGRLYGPNVTAEGEVTESEGLIAGVEYLAFAGKRSTPERITMMVQIPDSFDPAAPCIVTGPSSGSRGVYGAIGTSGEWGLKNGCAVTYTDKGTGTGAHDLQDDTVNLITGERADSDDAGRQSNFTTKLSDAERDAFNAESPNRFAFKHAHSGHNPEASWGRYVLESIEFAFWALNQEFPDAGLHPDNTVVIASSVSNGGGSSLLAAEQDRHGLIDGVAVMEPNVNPEPGGDFGIQQGDGTPFFDHSKSLLDYTTLLNLYQPCANLANPGAPFNLLALVGDSIQENRCTSLYELGLLSSGDPADRPQEAQDIINAFGILPEQNVVQPSHYAVFVPQAIAVTYANTYTRAKVTERLCGYTYGATQGSQILPDLSNPDTGTPIALPEAAEAVLFSTSNGIPPTAGVNLINETALGGPLETRASVSASTGRRDHNIDGALCTRSLATGEDPVTGEPLTGPLRSKANKVAQSIAAIRASGDLQGTPALIVTGRADAIIPPNHGSRAYFGLNRATRGEASRLHYIEVKNAQHLDAFNGLDSGFAARFIPLHHYFLQALDIMLAHLRAPQGTALPPSQVIQTVPRGTDGGTVPPVQIDPNLPPIEQAPDPANLITFDGDLVRIPE